ncbi:class I SAM-dependent methyltransferase [Umezawaea sp. Da 62-37]|uniref:class I SAM-dependent methyltransferase n=1 Tax=Umezawaea sp. Da 62-37 TaxID=3075927 RepID=UPI0028F6FB1E|nr:class I SAM-dependent methyltransferase [Umezawaea sp. Da 62-37]WNV86117.1 class I SAM-dependent methyltransferase [Umezawaea sp. Da 62-37]
MTDSGAEDFLRAFHDRRPGEQSTHVGMSRTTGGRTSYQEFADRVPGARRVLDLGCADGALLEVLAGRGAEVLAGIDLSAAELELARVRPALAAADLRLGRAQELPFADSSFDAVVSHMAFMLMTDVERVVAETARVLAPGGAFAVAVGGGAVPGEAMELFLALSLPLFKAAGTMPRLGDRRTRTREGLDGLLGAAGFAPVSWEPVVIDMGGTAEHVWGRMTGSFYDMEVLTGDQVAGLRALFLAEAPGLAIDGRVPCGVKIVYATTRLVL